MHGVPDVHLCRISRPGYSPAKKPRRDTTRPTGASVPAAVKSSHLWQAAQVRQRGIVVAVVVELPTKTCRSKLNDGACPPAPTYEALAPPMTLSASSSFRRYGQRDERRRRLLTDDPYGPQERPSCRVWTDDDPHRGKSEHYGDAAFLDQQLRVLDLVPRRLLLLSTGLIAAAGAIAGLEFAYAWMHERAAGGGANLAAFDLAAKGSLACWFSSLMLLAAAAAGLLIYSVRRHRADDYQGRYRVWLWAAGGCFLLATDQAAGLREALREMMISLTGTPLLGDGDLWWVAAYAMLFAAIGSRVLIDVRHCIPAVAALSVAALAHGLATVDHFGWTFFEGSVNRVMFRSGSEMAGNLLLLAGFGFFARYVVLDAEGLLPVRREDEEKERADEECRVRTLADGRRRKIDPPHAAPRPAYQPASPPSPTLPVAAPSSPARKLTKAERKALKKRLIQQRLERERKCG